MRKIRLDPHEHDIEDLIRYLGGDHHMSIYDRLQIIKSIQAQTPEEQVMTKRKHGCPDGEHCMHPWHADPKKRKPENLSIVAQGNHITAKELMDAVTPRGGCRVCGCPPEEMPMVNRGTGWCCENHREGARA